MKPSERETDHVSLDAHDLDSCQRFLGHTKTECLVIHFNRDRRYDIGALCYSLRAPNTGVIPRPVDIQSLRPERVAAIKLWCNDKITDFYIDKSSSNTLYTNAGELSTFTDWCDQNNHTNFLLNPDHYKHALHDYSSNLKMQITAAQGIKSFYANRLQSSAIKNGALFFPDSNVNLLEDLPIISVDASEKTSTVTPSETEIVTYLTPCQYLFDGLSDFVLNGLSFPYRIPYMEDFAHLIPGRYKISTPAVHITWSKFEHGMYWSYPEARLLSIEESISLSIRPQTRVIQGQLRVLAELQRCNDNLRHRDRIWLANLAHDAFIPIFAANAGLNESQIQALPWSPEYEVANSEHKGFTIIKPRGGNAVQQFEIQKSFLKVFKKFLKLRNYLCNNTDHPFLFINIKNEEPIPEPIIKNAINRFNDKVRHFIEPTFKNVSYRKLRKYKSVYLLTNSVPVEIVSSIMQSGANTIYGHYADAEEKEAIDELVKMYDLLGTFLNEGSSSIPAGDCSGTAPSRTPAAVEGYEPNCKDFLGCLYCNEFRLSTDRESIRKLLSMRFVTVQKITSCDDIYHFMEIHGDAVRRIDALLVSMSMREPSASPLIDEIQHDIENHFNLTTYWENLYERLKKIRVIK